MAIGTGADGGYTVTPELDAEIGRRLSVVSPIRALATVRQVSTAVLKKPFRHLRHGHRLGRRDGGAAADVERAARRTRLSGDGALRDAGGHTGAAG